MDKVDGINYLIAMAEVLELLGEPAEKIQAYQAAADSVTASTSYLWDQWLAGKGPAPEQIAPDISRTIYENARSGLATDLEALILQIPPGLFGLIQLPSLNPTLVRRLWIDGNIVSINQLERACKRERVMNLTGFDRNRQNRLMREIVELRRSRNRWLRSEAEIFARAREEEIAGTKGLLRMKRAGELRRDLEAVSEIVWVIAADNPRLVMGRIGTIVGASWSSEDQTDTIIIEVVDQPRERLVVVTEAEFAARHWLETGTESHTRAVLGELCQAANPHLLPASENEIYERASLSYIPPELRENRGEIDAAKAGTLPTLIVPGDIKGVLHVHTNWSDGRESIYQMVERAAGLGWEYIGITDHSQAAFYTHGLTPERIILQRTAIEKVRVSFPEMRIFHGIECDIQPDGQLDLPDSVLETLDFVIVSIHSVLQMERVAMTKRILKGIRNPHATMIAHPSGRLLLERESYPVDWDLVFDAAAETGTVIEFNARSERMDLDWRLIRNATKRGVLICINPDAHGVSSLSCINDGIAIARKGWLTADQVLNTKTGEQLNQWFERDF